MRKVNAVLVFAMSFYFASVYYLGAGNIADSAWSASLSLERPYVYRQLVPVLVRLLVDLGVRVDWATTLLIACAGVGFYLALDQLLGMFYKQDGLTSLLTVILILVFMVMFGEYRKPYDLFTAWFFTLALLYIAQGDDYAYTVLFPLICLNRETAFLLIPFFSAHALCVVVPDYRRLFRMSLYQAFVFVAITLGVRIVFAGNVGLTAWIEPVENVLRFINQPARSLLHFAVFGVMVFMVGRDWHFKPMFFRLALFCIFLPLVPMYIIFGQAFEVRVFWEVGPIMIALILPTLYQDMPALARFRFSE